MSDVPIYGGSSAGDGGDDRRRKKHGKGSFDFFKGKFTDKKKQDQKRLDAAAKRYSDLRIRSQQVFADVESRYREELTRINEWAGLNSEDSWRGALAEAQRERIALLRQNHNRLPPIIT